MPPASVWMEIDALRHFELMKSPAVRQITAAMMVFEVLLLYTAFRLTPIPVKSKKSAFQAKHR